MMIIIRNEKGVSFSTILFKEGKLSICMLSQCLLTELTAVGAGHKIIWNYKQHPLNTLFAFSSNLKKYNVWLNQMKGLSITTKTTCFDSD